MATHTPHALISGAGIAGLAAAWWLQRIGWQCTVIEQAPGLRDGGHMLGLSGPGLATARQMDLVDALQAVAFPDMGLHVYRDRNDREILRMDYRTLLRDMQWITLRRGDVVRTLYQRVADAVEVRFGQRITAVAQDAHAVQATLDDGSVLHGDLLLAADGVHSWLRQQLFAADTQALQPLGYRYASYEIDDPQQLAEQFVSYPEPALQSEYYALGHGRLAALHVWRSDDCGEVASSARVPLLQQVTARSNRFVRYGLQHAANDSPVVIDDLALVTLPRWHNGRVLLMGDAAHSLSLISGQGAGMALASASVLAQELQRGAELPQAEAIAAALERHDQRLRPTVLRLQQRSRRLAPAFVPAKAWSFHLRNLALRAMPDAMLRRFFLNGLKSEAEAMAALA